MADKPNRTEALRGPMDEDPFHGMQTEPCSFCGGSGTMRETKTLHYTSLLRGEDDGEPVERRAIIGEPCPACIGRGRVGVLGRKLNS